MSQFNQQPVRRGGSPDVFTGILFVAFLVLAAGVALMVLRVGEHGKAGGASGLFGLVSDR